jgi:ABC-type glycerol-3-phosphate transport system substrate-binding protein
MRRILCLLACLVASCTLADAESLRLWIIPVENAGPGDLAAGERIRERLDAFNREFSNSHVIVENTTDPVLKMQLLSWNQAFAAPNAAVVTSQTGTMKALAGFAEQAGVTIRVRFITWDQAFGLITGLNPDARSRECPDVIQIGSTWRAYLATRRIIMSRPNWAKDRGNWTEVQGLPASSLPYITDVRLLFYWKRLPSAPPTSPEFVLNASSWTALIDSIRARAGSIDTIAFPTGLTLNVLHDYAPIVWAGGGGFFVHGSFGWHADLTSPAALAVPLELQRRAIETPVQGEPRTLITFPESSHEEVDRIFVNGGHRVTQEPANFIDRWRQDFQKRHKKDGLKFWDYAAADVPPKSFLGGSYLVVTRGAADPSAAFALADFLATDPGFTRILAESGFLPSGRRGYGTDVLTSSLYKKTGSLPQVEHFVDSVQKAIQQGAEYPPFSEWPTEIENRRVQEAFQIIWRRMGERNPEQLRAAAKDAEWLINSRVYWVDEFWNGLIEARWALLATLFVAGCVATYFIYSRFKAERALLLLLFLYRAYRHDAAKFLGDNFFGIASEAKPGASGYDEFRDKVMALSIHFKDKLAPHIEKISEGQFTDFQGPSTMRLDEISDLAFCGATYIYEAKFLKEAPYIQYGAEALEHWTVSRMPFSLVVALEEWFLNSIKHIVANDLKNPILAVRINDRELIVESSGKVEEPEGRTLTRRPDMSDLREGRQGLKLIRNIIYYAYGKRIKVANQTSEHGQSRIRLSFPLKGHLDRI